MFFLEKNWKNRKKLEKYDKIENMGKLKKELILRCFH
jgi:hypothetical protein